MGNIEYYLCTIAYVGDLEGREERFALHSYDVIVRIDGEEDYWEKVIKVLKDKEEIGSVDMGGGNFIDKKLVGLKHLKSVCSIY